jgi:hypothetical protein
LRAIIMLSMYPVLALEERTPQSTKFCRTYVIAQSKIILLKVEMDPIRSTSYEQIKQGKEMIIDARGIAPRVLLSPVPLDKAKFSVAYGKKAKACLVLLK